MGCTASQEGSLGIRSPKVSVSVEDLKEYVALALKRLARQEAAIPCEFTGELHSNWTGPSRGFSSPEAMRQYQAMHMARIGDVGGNVLKGWHRLDADFTLQHFSVSGATPLPFRKLRPRVHQAMKKSEAQYRKAFLAISEDARFLVNSFDAVWPAESPEDLRERSVQLEDAANMSLIYSAGISRLEMLHNFSLALARYVGTKRKVEWSVKRPWRLWRKTIDKFPEDFADQDYRHITDVYRTSIIVESLAQVRQILDILEALGRDSNDRGAVLRALGLSSSRCPVVVERIKNRFRQPCLGGYMDILSNVRMDGYVMEVQVHLAELLDLRGEKGRQLHKWFKAFQRQWPEYTGDRAEDGSMHGSGMLSPAHGGRYVGEFQLGLRHGEGTFYYPNGDRYDGQFVEGNKHGHGTFTYTSGDYYKGGFENDSMHGLGTYHFANGERFEGEYSGGKRHGEGTYHYNNGTCLTGDWWRNKHVSVVGV